jgi:HPt (histidine-containing phosphotransfer) domain-containing protein
MAQQLSDLFALEAGEYLGEIDQLLTREAAPEAEHLLRLVRRVRGSARLAQADPVVEVAERFERACLAVMQGRLEWSGALRARCVRSVDDLRVLVRAIRSWDAADDERAAAAVRQWDDVIPRDASPASPADAPSSAGPSAAGRLLPFVRSELAGIRVELSRALDEWAIAADPAPPLARVQLRMRAVRGVQGVAALAPLLGLLETLDDLIRIVLRRGEPVHAQGRVAFHAGSAALAHAAGDVERDRFPVATDADATRFGQLVASLIDGDATGADVVVPIHSLFFDDGLPNVLASPVAPVPDGEVGASAVAEFVKLKATGLLDRAEGLLHDMRSQTLPAVGTQLAELASALGELAATYGVRPVRDAAERAVAELRGAQSIDAARSVLARVREAVGDGLHRVADAVLPDEPGSDEPMSAEVEAAAGVSADGEPGIVPIETLLLDGDDALGAALALAAELQPTLAAEASPALREAVEEVFLLLRQARARPVAG